MPLSSYFKKHFLTFLLISFVCVVGHVCHSALTEVIGQLTRVISPLTIWVPGTELRVSALIASTLTH